MANISSFDRRHIINFGAAKGKNKIIYLAMTPKFFSGLPPFVELEKCK
jgi:hypothetical protein